MSRRHVSGITIDSVYSKDLDDAIQLTKLDDGWLLTVTIADVAKKVLPGSELDERAKTMVVTRYYSQGTSPMITGPVEAELSLTPERPKKTMSIDIEFNTDFSVRKTEVYRSRFRSAQRLAYQDVPKILAEPEHSQHEHIKQLQDLALALLGRRRKSGAMVLYDLNHGWVTTEEGYLRKIEVDEANIGFIIVQETMIAANAAIAAFCVENDIPVPFRNHQARAAAPDRDVLLQELNAALISPMEDLSSFRHRTHMLLEKAKYSASLLGHYGLNLPAYLHFTSPIRRYADLLVHRQIRAFLKKEPLPYSKEQIEEMCVHINEVIAQEQKATAEFLKAKDEERTKRLAAEPRRLDALSLRDFERVFKQAARSGEDLDEGLLAACERRLAGNRVPPACFGTLFSEAPKLPGWDRLRTAVLQFMAKAPADAISTLHMLRQAEVIPTIDWTSDSFGPDHSRRFKSIAKVGPIEGNQVEAGSLKLAEQRAAVSLLAALAGIPTPTFPGLPPRKPEAAAAPVVRVDPVPSTTKDPVTALMEWSQAAKVSPPTFDFEMTGPPHTPTVTCTCRVRNTTRIATGSSKRDAKRAAAKACIDALLPAVTQQTV